MFKSGQNCRKTIQKCPLGENFLKVNNMSVLKVRNVLDGMTQFFELQDSKKSGAKGAIKITMPNGAVKYLSLYTPKSAPSSMFDGTSNVVINGGTRVALCSYCYDNCNHFYKNCTKCNKSCNGCYSCNSCNDCNSCRSCRGSCNSSCDSCDSGCQGCDSDCESCQGSCNSCDSTGCYTSCNDGCHHGDGGCDTGWDLICPGDQS